jgi:hypothetical protein
MRRRAISIQEIRDLVAHWQAQVEELGSPPEFSLEEAKAEVYQECADDLATVLEEQLTGEEVEL